MWKYLSFSLSLVFEATYLILLLRFLYLVLYLNPKMDCLIKIQHYCTTLLYKGRNNKTMLQYLQRWGWTRKPKMLLYQVCSTHSSLVDYLLLKWYIKKNPANFIAFFIRYVYTPARIHSISLKIDIFDLKMMVKSYIEFLTASACNAVLYIAMLLLLLFDLLSLCLFLYTFWSVC